jgi:hypothetical protein
MPKQTNAFKCEFCRKLYATVKGCTTHEQGCGKNPLNKSVCFDCDYLRIGKRVYWGLDREFTGTTFTCSKLLLNLRSYKLGGSPVLRTDNYLSETVRMPNICEHFSERDIMKDIQLIGVRELDERAIQSMPDMEF